MYGRKFEDEAAKFHMTFIIGNDQPRYQSMERIQEASLAMGYKYEIRDFRIKGGSAAVCIANVGVARSTGTPSSASTASAAITICSR